MAKKKAGKSRMEKRQVRQMKEGPVRRMQSKLFKLHEQCKEHLADDDSEHYMFLAEMKEMEQKLAAALLETRKGNMPDVSFIEDIARRCQEKSSQRLKEERERLAAEKAAASRGFFGKLLTKFKHK